MIAWTLFGQQSRRAFRWAVGQDAGTRDRARGWAPWKALLDLADQAGDNRGSGQRRVIDEILIDHQQFG
jgi:hypothetical protein